MRFEGCELSIEHSERLKANHSNRELYLEATASLSATGAKKADRVASKGNRSVRYRADKNGETAAFFFQFEFRQITWETYRFSLSNEIACPTCRRVDAILNGRRTLVCAFHEKP
jgi:hypothetical protein